MKIQRIEMARGVMSQLTKIWQDTQTSTTPKYDLYNLSFSLSFCMERKHRQSAKKIMTVSMRSNVVLQENAEDSLDNSTHKYLYP